MKKAVYAGSFDPLTIGHIDIIKRACNLFDEVCVLINTNPAKTSLLSIDDKRLSIKYDAIEEHNLSNVTVHECSDEYTVDYCKKIGAKFLVRGIRNSKDYEYEDTLANFNKHLNDEIETVILFADTTTGAISSSGIKSLVGFNTWEQRIKPFLPYYSYNIMLEKNNAYMDLFVNAVSLLSNWKVGDPDFYNPSERYYELLKNRYSVTINKRHYHSMNHIINGLSILNDSNIGSNSLSKENHALLTLAYFYHDYQYNTKYPDDDNIKDSIRMLEAHHKKDLDKVDKKYFKIIKRLILVTDHKSEPHTYLERYICDMDLSLFYLPTDEFIATSKLIRREYSVYPDKEWNKGRRDFLNKMYMKENFFHILPNNDTIEKQAKENIQFELNLLSNPNG